MIVSKRIKAIRIWATIFFLSFFCSSHSMAQDHSASLAAPALTHYPKIRTLKLDSVKGDDANYLIAVQWMDTTFQLDRKHHDFIKNVPVPKEDNLHYSVYREGRWDGNGFVLPHSNCHNFGMAQAFNYEGIDVEPLFNTTTFLEGPSLDAILATAFHKVNSLDATAMKDLLQEIEEGSLLVFRDSSGYALHTAFQGREGLLSKNGRFEPRIYNRLDYLKRVYYDAITIDVYRMNADRVRAYLEQHGLQALRKE